MPAVLLGAWMGLTSCSAPQIARPHVPPGPALKEPISFELALFYPQPPKEDPRAALDALLSSDFAGFTRIDEIREEEIGNRKIVSAIWVTDGSYVAPDPESLGYFGRGLADGQAEALQESESVLRLVFSHGKEHVWTALRDSGRLTSALARRTGGLIWDEETREMFAPDFWDEHRLSAWTEAGPPPSISAHFTVHTYQKENGYHRLVSLGLGKLGLPDLVIEDFPGSRVGRANTVLNLLAQTLSEGKPVGSEGAFDLELQSLGRSDARDRQLEALAANARAVARLRLVEGVWEEGDPENRLFEIVFDRYKGPDTQARQTAMLLELFGAEEDAAVEVQHDAEMLAASRKAREKLLAFKPAFQAGLPPGEVLLVKAPFHADGGREWMWVEVIEWKGDVIVGTLRNEPAYIPSLKEGQRVEVSETEVFDYMRNLADGSSEGNETAKLLHPEG
ncbi:MAG: hypothetical protein QOH06_4258 [Acidobacteriota bacterium]|jgi:uncharacterized protein YegJ (DUF2314 family)|nr:hypothetical protein [Acidobacteriota bacterium]